MFCLSGVEIDFRGGHHEHFPVPLQGIITAVGVATAMFLGQDATVMYAVISLMTAVGTSNVVS